MRIRHPLRSAVDLFRSRWFTIGWVVAIGAWVLHVGALALTPLSIVQAVLSGGLVFLAVLAERFFGFRLGRRQWAGVIVTAAGLAIIGLTSGSADDGEIRRYALAALIAIECGVFAVGTAIAAGSTHHRIPPAAQGLLLGAAAGALFGVSDIAIVGGILVFRDPIGTGGLEITGRMLAFCLVVVGAALIPAPVRATKHRPISQRRQGPERRHRLPDVRVPEPSPTPMGAATRGPPMWRASPAPRSSSRS